MASIMTAALSGKAATTHVERAGKGGGVSASSAATSTSAAPGMSRLSVSAYAAFTAGKSLASATNTVVLTHAAREDPAELRGGVSS